MTNNRCPISALSNTAAIGHMGLLGILDVASVTRN